MTLLWPAKLEVLSNRSILTLFALIWLAGCENARSDLCLIVTRPPYTDGDVAAVSDGLARWLLEIDTVLDGCD